MLKLKQKGYLLVKTFKVMNLLLLSRINYLSLKFYYSSLMQAPHLCN